MERILNDYDINQRTMALLAAAHIDYDTIVLETNQTLYVRKTPFQLIKAACLDGGAAYEGRRASVTHRTGAKQKVPIPINPNENIYAFPTLSPKEFHCSWIFYHHVKSIESNQLQTVTTSQSIITFKNREQIYMNESLFVLNKQMQRTADCILKFSSSGQDFVQKPLIKQTFV